MSYDPDIVEIEHFRSVDDALHELFGGLGLERLGGPSGKGWSLYAALQRCSYYYSRTYGVGFGSDGFGNADGAGATRRTNGALETGIVFHLLLALYYQALIDVTSPYAQIDRTNLCCQLVAAGCSAKDVHEGERMADAYTMRYDAYDYIEPIAVELLATAPKGRTCRFDLVAKVREGAELIAGYWVVEHKTASRLDLTTTQGWLNGGEVIGQQLIWREAGLDKTFGPLQGTIVNLAVKTKVPQLQRIVVPVQEQQLAQHAADLDYWEALRCQLHRTGNFPRSRAGCVTHNRLCELFYECAGA